MRARAALQARVGLCEDSRMSNRSAGSELLSMMGLVAAVVAIVILVFFGVGYLFGRLFL
jgi:type IV secretory pathway VirB2 component (pilin)